MKRSLLLPMLALAALLAAGVPVAGMGPLVQQIDEDCGWNGLTGFIRYGPFDYWHDVWGFGEGGHSLYTANSNYTHDTQNMADWVPYLPQAGRYHVVVTVPPLPPTYALSPWKPPTGQARYEITHAPRYGNIAAMVVGIPNIQYAYNRHADFTDIWTDHLTARQQDLGIYRFDAGNNNTGWATPKVRLIDYSEDPYNSHWVGFDTVRFYKVDDGEGWAGALDGPGPSQRVGFDNVVTGWGYDTTELSDIVRVEVLINGQPLSGVQYGLPGDPYRYRCTWDARQWVNQAVTVTARLWNDLGESREWSSTNVLIPNTPPNPPALVSPADNSLMRPGPVTFSWADGGDPDNGPYGRRFAIDVFPAAGWATIASSGWIAGTSWIWTPPGAGVYQWNVRATDGANESARSATRRVTLNSPPAAQPITLTTTKDSPVSLLLSATDPDGDPLSYGFATQPAHGAFSGTAPALVYTPAAGYVGNDTFQYFANDGKADSAPATVTITVTDGTPRITAACIFLGRNQDNTLVATVRLTNIGTAGARNATLTQARLGSASASGLPAPVPLLGKGKNADVQVFFGSQAPGPSVVTLSGTFVGGTFAAASRVTIP